MATAETAEAPEACSARYGRRHLSKAHGGLLYLRRAISEKASGSRMPRGPTVCAISTRGGAGTGRGVWLGRVSTQCGVMKGQRSAGFHFTRILRIFRRYGFAFWRLAVVVIGYFALPFGGWASALSPPCRERRGARGPRCEPRGDMIRYAMGLYGMYARALACRDTRGRYREGRRRAEKLLSDLERNFIHGPT